MAQSHRRRRRRRSHHSGTSTAAVRSARGRRDFRLHSAEVLASIGVAIAAVTLITLIWLAEGRSVDNESNDLRARVEARISSQASLVSDLVRRQMEGVEQSLRVLKAAFQADPDHFDMTAWRERMPVLTDATDDVFIADPGFIIRHDLKPPEVGLRIGARVSDMFGPEFESVPLNEPFMGAAVQMVQTRQHVLLMLLRLDRPGGWLLGGAYRTDALRQLFVDADLGVQGMTALIDTRLGRVQSVVGPAAAEPNYDIAKSPMYAAMQRVKDGTWVGPSAPDRVRRIHAFHPVPDHQLTVIIAVDEADAMRPAVGWARDVRLLAVAATAVVLAAAGTALYVVWTFRSKRRVRQTLDRERALVAKTQADLVEARDRLGGRYGQLHALFASIEEGTLVLDSELRLSEWNQHFPALFGVAPETMQFGLPLDELLRIQARQEAFGVLDDVEAEVAKRLAQLRTGSETVPTLYAAPGGRTLASFTSRHADGSLLLVLREATEQDLHPVPEEFSSSPEASAAERF